MTLQQLGISVSRWNNSDWLDAGGFPECLASGSITIER
jgi:hypothetical protein